MIPLVVEPRDGCKQTEGMEGGTIVFSYRSMLIYAQIR